jgi:lambda family phage minor tail protein L
MSYNADIQKLEPGERVQLFEMDATPAGGQILRWHNYTQAGPIVWQGESFYPWAVQIEGLGRTGQGQQPVPTLIVSNIGPDANGVIRAGVIEALCIALGDLVGCELKVHLTLGKYLDAVNFPGGNPSANPNEHYALEVWLVEQKTNSTPEAVTFMLSSPLDFDEVQLPSGVVTTGTCQWLWKGGYRGPFCTYSGNAYFDTQDNRVYDPALDRCGGRPLSCQLRFGAQQGRSNEAAIIMFGGFPSADRVRG